MYAIVDIETTGGYAASHGITEISVFIHDGTKVVKHFETLVNPQQSIPRYITSLTGIDDAMVEDAPTFAQVSKQLLELLEGAVFVAHNVRFDHGFVANELARLDVTLKAKTLCTVRLSRRLYPQHKGHGLDAILQRHGLQTQARHRAMGGVSLGTTTSRLRKNEVLSSLNSRPLPAQAARALGRSGCSMKP